MSSSLLSAAVHAARCCSWRKDCSLDGSASINGCDIDWLVFAAKATETYTLNFCFSSLTRQKKKHSQNSTLFHLNRLFVLSIPNKRNDDNYTSQYELKHQNKD